MGLAAHNARRRKDAKAAKAEQAKPELVEQKKPAPKPKAAKAED
jgi:hypothetical protein